MLRYCLGKGPRASQVRVLAKVQKHVALQVPSKAGGFFRIGDKGGKSELGRNERRKSLVSDTLKSKELHRDSTEKGGRSWKGPCDEMQVAGITGERTSTEVLSNRRKDFWLVWEAGNKKKVKDMVDDCS